MTDRLAVVFCVHHKPWLMMSTLLTFAGQEPRPADLFFAYNVGDGENRRGAYAEYREIAARDGCNPQLSPFDERVRGICRLRWPATFEVEYENDHALDSGTWYKFIRDGRWRDYEYVLFLGEGTLLAHPHVLRALPAFARRRGVHFVASGHEKRRLPRCVVTKYQPPPPGEPESMDQFHDRMVEETFGVFARDPAFRAVYERWGSDFAPATEHHVPGVVPGGRARERRVRAYIQKRWGSTFTDPDVPLLARLLRALPSSIDRWRSRAGLALPAGGYGAGPFLAYAGGTYDARPTAAASEVDVEQGVTFHRVDPPEWFGCATNHLMSRSLLEKFHDKLTAFGMYDVLDMPFAGTALEVVWGFLPAWLGFEKWFTNGFHRPRKHFSTYQREDYPPEMAAYINRYHRGRLVVDADGEFIKLRAWRPELGDLRELLPAAYF